MVSCRFPLNQSIELMEQGNQRRVMMQHVPSSHSCSYCFALIWVILASIIPNSLKIHSFSLKLQVVSPSTLINGPVHGFVQDSFVASHSFK